MQNYERTEADAIAEALRENPDSPEALRRLEEWSDREKARVEAGERDVFDFDLEEARIRERAGLIAGAVRILKASLVMAIQENHPDKRAKIEEELRRLGGDPEDLFEIYG